MALSPLPIIAVVLMLTTPQARVNGPAFVAGWLAGLAVTLAGINPKTWIAGGQQALAYLVFAVIGTLGIGAPVVIYFAMGDRSEKVLARLKDWMSEHNAVIMSVLCLIIGVKLIGDAISGLAG